jgi:hypothetical protein
MHVCINDSSVEAAVAFILRRGHRRLVQILSLGVLMPLLAVTSSSVGATQRDGQIPNINVTNDSNYRWGEPEIAINPRDPLNIVYTAVGEGFTNACQQQAQHDPNSPCALQNTVFGPQPNGLMNNVQGFSVVDVWVTFDGGRHWTKTARVSAQIPVFPQPHSQVGEPGDPLVTAGPDGTFYLGWDAIHFDNLPTTIVDSGEIASSTSKDGGLTWSAPVATGTTIDRPFFASDHSTGVIYEASTGQVPGPLESGDPSTPATGPLDRYLVSSTDGVHWTTARGFGVGFGLGLRMAAAHGVLATAFLTGPSNANLCGSSQAPCTVFETTTNAGATWTRDVVPVPSNYVGAPLVAADPSFFGKGHYTLAFLTNAGAQFTVYQTRDGGNTWSGPTTVSDDPTKEHYHAWMSYGPDGALAMMWKTADTAPGGTIYYPYNVWSALSIDGGAHFSLPLKITATESLAPDSRPFGNAGDDFSFTALNYFQVLIAYADWNAPERAGFFSPVNFWSFLPELRTKYAPKAIK